MVYSCLKNICLNASGIVQSTREVHSSVKLNCIADGGLGTHKPTPFQEKILLWTKTYKSQSDIPRRVTRCQMKNAMDKFRVRVSIGMIAATFVVSGIVMVIGHRERAQGKSITKMAMERREH